MKSSNILMMAMLMVGIGSNLFSVATITNNSDQIIGVQFYDQSKNPLPLVHAGEDQIAGELWYGGTTMNISKEAAFVTASYIQGIPNTNTYKIIKDLVNLFPVENSKSYHIIGFVYEDDINNTELIIIPWSIMDSDTYKKSDIKNQLELFNAVHSIENTSDECVLKCPKQKGCTDSSYIGWDCASQECKYTCRQIVNNEMLASPEVNSYLADLQNAAKRNDAPTFEKMLNQATVLLHAYHKFTFDDMQQIMKDVAKITPMNFDTFYNYMQTHVIFN